jgi:integrase
MSTRRPTVGEFSEDAALRIFAIRRRRSDAAAPQPPGAPPGADIGVARRSREARPLTGTSDAFAGDAARRAGSDAAAKPTFKEFALRWFERQTLEGGRAGTGLAAKSRQDLEWRLGRHLLPAFGSRPIDEISVQDVDGYRFEKVRNGALAPSSINKTIATLASILEVAVEYDLIDRNPAHGRRRRLRSPTPKRPWLDRAGHIAALLDGARVLDQHARAARGQRRALLATLVFGGLRVGEALALRWRDVDLVRGTMFVTVAKTDAGMRTVNILPVLHGELTSYRSQRTRGENELVFCTRTGHPHDATNIRRRVLAKSIEHANAALKYQRVDPLPRGLTPHALRRTFASLLFAMGEAPPYVMAQMGHTSANLTLSIYARQMDRRDGEPERLRALVEGRAWRLAARAAQQPAAGGGPKDHR